MDAMSDDLSLLQDMDPHVRDTIAQAQSQFASSIKNPDLDRVHKHRAPSPIDEAEEEDEHEAPMDGVLDELTAYVPPKFRVGHLRKDASYRRDEPYADDMIDDDHDEVTSNTSSERRQDMERKKAQEHQQRLCYVVEMVAFAKELHEVVPNEMQLMRMPFQELKIKWELLGEKYNREKLMVVARQALAYFGQALGYSFNTCYKYVMNADYMDMAAWAEHWYVTSTVNRPDKPKVFDTSLMVVFRRFQFIREAAVGELSLLTAIIENIRNFKLREDAAKREEEKRMQESEDRVIDKVRAHFDAMMKAQQQDRGNNFPVTPMDDQASMTSKKDAGKPIEEGGGGGDVDAVMANLPFDDDVHEEETTLSVVENSQLPTTDSDQDDRHSVAKSETDAQIESASRDASVVEPNDASLVSESVIKSAGKSKRATNRAKKHSLVLDLDSQME